MSQPGLIPGPVTLSIHRLIELFGAVWAVTGAHGPGSTPANPWLTGPLALIEQAASHPAVQMVRTMRAASPRDRLLKALVQTAVGSGPASAHGRMLLKAFADLDGQIGAAFEVQVASHWKEAISAAEELATGLMPGAEMESLCLEPVPVRAQVLPSLFLPQPQEGRHGVTLTRADGSWDLLMIFGMPLDRPLKEEGISRRWLQRGGWHYTARYYILQQQPAFERAVAEAATTDAALALAQRLPPFATGSLDAIFRNHLSMALRYGLWRLEGQPADTFLLLAEAQGMLLIRWFARWMERYLEAERPEGRPLSALLPQMATAFCSELESVQAIAAAARPPLPSVITCALLPYWAQGARAVVPDEWLAPGSPRAERLRHTWNSFRMPLTTWKEWLSDPEAPTHPAVLYGGPQYRPIAEGLARLGAGLPPPSETLVALDRNGGNWRLLITGQEEERIASPDANRLMLLPCSQAILHHEGIKVMIQDDDLALDFTDALL